MKHIALPLLLSMALVGAGCSAKTQTSVDVAPTPDNSDTRLADPSHDTGTTHTDTGMDNDADIGVEADTRGDVKIPEVNPPKVEVKTKTHAVSIQNFAYSQGSLTVNKGDKIVFTQKDSMQHTVTADAGAFDSGLLSAGQSFTLDTSKLAPGTYGYHCRPHPDMTGTIIVK